MDQNWPNSCPYYYVPVPSRAVVADGADIMPRATASNTPMYHGQMDVNQQTSISNGALLGGQVSAGATVGVAGSQDQNSFANVVVPVATAGGIEYQSLATFSTPLVPRSEGAAFGQSQSYRGNRAGVQVKMRQDQLFNKALNYLSRTQGSTPYNSKGRRKNLLAEVYQLVAEMMPSYIYNNYQLPAAFPQMQLTNFDQPCPNQLQQIPAQAPLINQTAPYPMYPGVHQAANQANPGLQTKKYMIYQTPSGQVQQWPHATTALLPPAAPHLQHLLEFTKRLLHR